MRKIFLLLLVLAAWLPGYRAQAQLNKAYFFYAGRSFLIESKYRGCGRPLNKQTCGRCDSCAANLCVKRMLS